MKVSTKHIRMSVLVYMAVFILVVFVCVHSSGSKPNIVVLFADDVGYGDLACYGHPASYTPNLDGMAKNGMLFTSFYSAANLCSPSRAALLTGRYHIRSGIYPFVLGPDSTGGLPRNETTIANILKQQGYHTAMIGKWDLGIGKDMVHFPMHYGFDKYYGVPYVHGACPCETCFYPHEGCQQSVIGGDKCGFDKTYCPLFQNMRIIQQPVDLLTLAEKYVDFAKDFITDSANAGESFFLYLAYNHCHFPQFAGKRFHNFTQRGIYGDSLAEIDWSVGEILQQLRHSQIENNTLVFFTSDNGAALRDWYNGGSSGMLKCGKATTYEGGHRVPAIAYWPGQITAGVSSRDFLTTLDLLPTITKLSGSVLPKVTIDGMDMSSVLFGQAKSARDNLLYYPAYPDKKIGAYAIRYKHYKAHFYTEGSPQSGMYNADTDCHPNNTLHHDPPLLYDLDRDPGELYNMNKEPQYKDVLEEIKQVKTKLEDAMIWGTSQVNKPKDPRLEPCCIPGCDPFPSCCRCD
ncbi:arylsulfatase A-like [Saccoglossus kowalevskii]|uniref:Arylsulfatase A-like n=1 Tax=Saccoglossus kowalevskii TaxID=10224 RepID=A0ABM0GKI3_SACKO|nr:PREDICTED: arylsulfatase A-like [Saccoglossus kowalevskii]